MTVSPSDLQWFTAQDKERNAWRVGAKKQESEKELEDMGTKE